MLRQQVMSDDLIVNEKQGSPIDLDKKPPFIFHYRDDMFNKSVAFARKLDHAHDQAVKNNLHFKFLYERSK